MTDIYNILILGSGPIGASTAHFLTEQGIEKVGLITQDPTDDHSATYGYAGGSVRWYWDTEIKTEMTTMTSDFIFELDKQGVDLSLVKDNYLFLDIGKYVPSLNVNGKKLVRWFLDQAVSKSLELHEQEMIVSVIKENDIYIVKTNKAEYRSHKVLFALGTKNTEYVDGYTLAKEKRLLSVLDLPVGEYEQNFPHTIISLPKGEAYIFIKKFPEGLRFVVGQEDVLEESDQPGEENHFEELLSAGLAVSAPFLKNAKVEKILWGFDTQKKTLTLEEPQQGMFVANCGSAIRACVWIGKEVAKKLQD